MVSLTEWNDWSIQSIQSSQSILSFLSRTLTKDGAEVEWTVKMYPSFNPRFQRRQSPVDHKRRVMKWWQTNSVMGIGFIVPLSIYWYDNFDCIYREFTIFIIVNRHGAHHFPAAIPNESEECSRKLSRSNKCLTFFFPFFPLYIHINKYHIYNIYIFFCYQVNLADLRYRTVY